MKYYLIGIKGSGMSGLAQILYDLGNEVKGSDVKDSLFCESKVLEKGIVIEDIDNMDYSKSDIVIVGNVFIDKIKIIDKEVLTYQEALSHFECYGSWFAACDLSCGQVCEFRYLSTYKRNNGHHCAPADGHRVSKI